MAAVRICDRCGVVIEDKTKRLFKFGAFYYNFMAREGFDHCYRDYDICKTCGDKLVEFLDGKEFDNGT